MIGRVVKFDSRIVACASNASCGPAVTTVLHLEKTLICKKVVKLCACNCVYSDLSP